MKTYSEIVEIKAPSSALPGAMVSVDITVKNKWDGYLHLFIYPYIDSSYLYWQDVWLGPGNEAAFNVSFTMPSKSVAVLIELYYLAEDGYLYLDDSQTQSVALSAVTPQVSEFKIKDFVKV